MTRQMSILWDSHELKSVLTKALDGCIIKRKFKNLYIKNGLLEVIYAFKPPLAGLPLKYLSAYFSLCETHLV
jgi:hypothetical protein